MTICAWFISFIYVPLLKYILAWFVFYVQIVFMFLLLIHLVYCCFLIISFSFCYSVPLCSLTFCTSYVMNILSTIT